jgi:hypothetical protein
MSYTCNNCQKVLNAGEICDCEPEESNPLAYCAGWWAAMDACRTAGIKTALNKQVNLHVNEEVSVEDIYNEMIRCTSFDFKVVANAIHHLIYGDRK